MRTLIFMLYWSIPFFVILAALAWGIIWLPAYGNGTLAARSSKRLAFLACTALFFIVLMFFEWRWAARLPPSFAGPYTSPLSHTASMVRPIGALIGIAASVGLFFVMLANPLEKTRGHDIQEFGEGYYRAVLATASVILFLSSGALLLGLIID